MVGSSASLVICSAATRSVGDVRRAMIAVRGHAKVGCRDHDRGYRHGGAADHQQSPEAGPMRKPVDGQTRQCRYCDPRHPPAHHQRGDKWCGTEQDTESHRGPHAVGRPHRVIAGRAWANARLVQFRRSCRTTSTTTQQARKRSTARTPGQAPPRPPMPPAPTSWAARYLLRTHYGWYKGRYISVCGTVSPRTRRCRFRDERGH